MLTPEVCREAEGYAIKLVEVFGKCLSCEDRNAVGMRAG